MSKTRIEIGFDRPLEPSGALGKDKLGRGGFARAATEALSRVGATSGFVLSIEGAWGSGKTSTLAMMEELLRQNKVPPVVVHFNPWLVGDRDALLRNFISKIAREVRAVDHAENGKKVARELKAYSKVFDVLKFVPGAEPFASIVKAVIDAAGDATSSVAEYKVPDIEEKKVKVEEALRKFDRPIVVFIDDLDRLFPQEVYEMVRIVKAIGDLPNVGYVLAFDPQYVSQALAVAAVPNASSYMDKIVQVRLPLPAISLEARRGLINEALEQLPAEAHESYFPEALDRMRGLYFSGLREVLEQPRDFARVFNSVGVLEPVLRGEVVLADVVGLAALMVKAEPVYELLRSEPRLFVGLLPSDSLTSRLPKDIVKAGSKRRSHAYEKCGNTAAVRALVHHLFPLVEEAEAKYSLGRVQGVRGHLADPSRFLVAHQLRVGGEDVSFVRVRRFLTRADERSKLVEGLTQENCLEFLELLGDYAKSGGVLESSDVAALCLDVARMVEAEPFLTKAKNDSGVFSFPVETVAARAISSICQVSVASKSTEIAKRIVADSRALSVATELFSRSYLSQDGDGRSLCAAKDKSMLAKQLLQNVVAAAEQGRLFDTAHPGFILWILAKAAPRGCKRIFEAIYKADPSLDKFALAYLGDRIGSGKGRSFSLPDDPKQMEVFCNLKWLTNHAKTRLKDSAVQLPVKAAWAAVVEGGRFYGVDGSRAR